MPLYIPTPTPQQHSHLHNAPHRSIVVVMAHSIGLAAMEVDGVTSMDIVGIEVVVVEDGDEVAQEEVGLCLEAVEEEARGEVVIGIMMRKTEDVRESERRMACMMRIDGQTLELNFSDLCLVIVKTLV